MLFIATIAYRSTKIGENSVKNQHKFFPSFHSKIRYQRLISKQFHFYLCKVLFCLILYPQGLKLHKRYCHNVYLGVFCRKLKLLSKGDHFWNLLWKLSKWILKHTKGSLLYLQQRFLLLLYPFIYEESYNSE